MPQGGFAGEQQDGGVMLRPLFARIREIAVRAAGFLKRVALLPRCLFLTGCELEIHDRGGGLAASGAYVGEGLSLPYFRRLYGSPTSRTRLIPLWALPRFIRSARKRSDIVLVELNALLAALFRGACAISEAWIRQVTRLDGDCYLHRVRGIHRGWGQQVRRQGFEYRITQSESDLQRFYDEFYVPYAQARHGEDASIRGLSELKAALRRGFLLQVWQQDRWISGLVVARRHDRLELLAAGADSPDELRKGGLSALYFFLFLWARQAGIEAIDFCGSRPNLLDGVFHHKALWGAEPVLDTWHHTKIAFYVKPGVRLPEVVASQLVTTGGRFFPLGEILSDRHPGLDHPPRLRGLANLR